MRKVKIGVSKKIIEEGTPRAFGINHCVRKGNKYELIEFAFAYRNSPRSALGGAFAGVELLFRFVGTSANINIPTLDLIAQNGF